ncbi:MAG: 50S ribosomal protein L3 [Candidatus Aenigmatarchaeota archaeon]
MPRRTKPRRGTMQFYPRKRAKRIYPSISHYVPSKETKPLGFAGYKTGMTHVQFILSRTGVPERVIAKSATIIDCAPLFVAGIRFYRGHECVGEKWVAVSKSIERKIGKGVRKGGEPEKFDDVRLIIATQPEKTGMKKIKADIFELVIGGDAEKKYEYAKSILGKEIRHQDVFKVGEYLDASAVTKGHGYTGSVKRFGIRIQTRKDEQSHRHVGSIGSTTPRKIDWRVPMPGQYGFSTRTEYNKRVLLISDDIKKVMPKGGFLGYGIPKSFMLIEGSIPGSKKRLIRFRHSVRAKKFQPVELKYISLESKQGK